MKIDLLNKVSLVTGAGGSIGGAVVKKLAENGARVFINDINAEAGEANAADINKKGGFAKFIQGDVTSETEMESFVKAAMNEFGRIDILVNNAGVNVGGEHRKVMPKYDKKAWDLVLDVCLDSVYYCTKHAAKIMKEQGCGKIVNVGSVAGWNIPLRLQSPYCIAKSAIINITKSLAMEYARHNINVNVVVPGSILNEQVKSAVYKDDASTKSMMAHIPFGRIGDPNDIANAVLYFVSDEAGYVTGAALNVDGGWTAGYTLDIEQ